MNSIVDVLIIEYRYFLYKLCTETVYKRREKKNLLQKETICGRKCLKNFACGAHGHSPGGGEYCHKKKCHKILLSPTLKILDEALQQYTSFTVRQDLPVFVIYSPTGYLFHRPAGSTGICNIFTDKTQLTVQQDLPVFVIYSPT